jgi:hypothetical protein
MEPSITFDIVYQTVIVFCRGNQYHSSKTNAIAPATTELNKQVFALLLLNRFIGENPFASERRQFCRIDSKRVQVNFVATAQ